MYRQLLLLCLSAPGFLQAQVPTVRTPRTMPPRAIPSQPVGSTALNPTLTDAPAPVVQLRDTLPGSVTLIWMVVSGASGYLVARKDLGTITPNPLPPVATSFSHGTDIDYRVSYEYRVTAQYPDGRIGVSNAVAFVPPRPVNPSNFTPIMNKMSVTLNWQPVTGVSHYLLGGSGVPSEGVKVPAKETSYRLEYLPPGAHEWSVASYYGTVSTPHSEWSKTAATLAATGPDLRVETYGGGTTLDFRWTPFSGVNWYRLVRADTPNGPYSEPSRVQYGGRRADGSFYLPLSWSRDDGVKIGNKYYYKLLALFPNMEPGESAVLPVAVGPKLSGVTNLRAWSPGPGRVLLTWTAPADAPVNPVHYEIYRGQVGDRLTFIARDFVGSSYEDKDVYTGATYRYQLVPRYGPNRIGEPVNVSVKVGP